MTDDELIALLVERGHEGVSVDEVARRDPSAHQHVYDYSDFDSDLYQDDRVYDLGERGWDDPDILRSAASRLAGIVRYGAVLTVAGARPGTVDIPAAAGVRVVLEGWSGLPPVCRDKPSREELDLTDPVAITEAFLMAGGSSGHPRGHVAWWTSGVRDRPDDDPYMDNTWRRAAAQLRSRGWDIRYYWGKVSGDTLVQAAAAPGMPMRVPADVPPVPQTDRTSWPEHSYRYAPALFDALKAADERHNGISWFGGRPANPYPNFGSPRYMGEPVPDGEAERARVLRWAAEHGHQEVARLAVEGSVELIVDGDPVGLEEIASRLRVARGTVDRWRSRGVLPAPKWTVGGRPAWPWNVIEAWARETGRLPAEQQSQGDS